MKRLYIKSAKKYTLLDDGDYSWAKNYIWHISSEGYARRNAKKPRKKINALWLHKLVIWTPNKYEVDHINGNRLDNRKENLRIVTHVQNQQNKCLATNNTSGYKGVTWDKRRKGWVAQITANHKYQCLGVFKTKLEAHKAYQQAASKLHGEFKFARKGKKQAEAVAERFKELFK